MAMRLKPTNDLENFCAMLEVLTCARVVNFLAYLFDAGKCWIKVNGMNTTPERLLTDLSCIADMKADQVWPVEFVGGPPGKIKTYKGSLLTLLADRALNAASTGSKRQTETLLRSIQ